MTLDLPGRSDSEQRPGHHWKEVERVHNFVARMDARVEERDPQFQLMARLLPFLSDFPLRLLDIGAGYGAAAAVVLRFFPRATATLLDVSEEMIRIGHERMAPFEGRYVYALGDFADGALPEDAGGAYHAIISSLAIHHLPAAGKRSLYQDIARHLLPGGAFLNLDSVAAANRELQAIYDRIEDEERQASGEASQPAGHHHSELQPLDQHLQWLSEAGLVNIDCFWKRLGTCLFGGFRPKAG